jgi:FkbM family methyltransferase
MGPRRSFSQDGEDLMVARELGAVRYFVDIGANDGISTSNTFYFALRGARGICFEPVAETFARLSALYRFNPRVRCVQCGISDQNRVVEIAAADALSFVPETEDRAHTDVNRDGFIIAPKPESVCLTRFDNAAWCADLPAEIDLLSVDVEGHELPALRSIPFGRYRFRALVIETHIKLEGEYKWRHRDLEAINALLGAAGYRPARETRINTLYLPA